MPLHLFGVRNFAVGNLTTLSVYGGLAVATFFTVVFIQQVGGYTPIAAGLSLLPITLLMFLLASRFGRLADRLGSRPFMAGGPMLAGAGFLLFARVGAHPSYLTELLPAVLVFGLGLAATVAPLTATVLGAVPGGHSGLASGTNNAMSRIAGLLAIAAVGAAVSAAFVSRVSQHESISSRVRTEIRTQPLVTTATGLPARDHGLLVDASVHAFHTGMEIAAALAALGGVIALIGIKNRG
jgi:predicted MFS family arabinose efflux permease